MPGFPARRQFYWRKLRLFDPLFFLADSLRRGLGKLSDQLQKREERLSRFREAPESLQFALSVSSPRAPLSVPFLGRGPGGGEVAAGGTRGRARSKFRVGVTPRPRKTRVG